MRERVRSPSPRVGEAGWKALLAAAFLLPPLLGILTAAGGCGGERTAAEWLQACGRAAAEYVDAGGYLRFLQESENVFATGQGTLTQSLRVEGEIIFPERERYEYREELVSSKRPDDVQGSDFSYVTLDGGRTAYVRGERLASRLGVAGWVHYTPPAGENRYFDYLKMAERLAAAGEGAKILGREAVGGRPCVRVAFNLGPQELLDLRLREDSSFPEGYRDGDWESSLGDLQVEVWIAEDGALPVQVCMRSESSEGGLTATSLVRMYFEGYGEEPLRPIEGPAVFAEAG